MFRAFRKIFKGRKDNGGWEYLVNLDPVGKGPGYIAPKENVHTGMWILNNTNLYDYGERGSKQIL